jgi:hypothetical protein
VNECYFRCWSEKWYERMKLKCGEGKIEESYHRGGYIYTREGAFIESTAKGERNCSNTGAHVLVKVAEIVQQQ